MMKNKTKKPLVLVLMRNRYHYLDNINGRDEFDLKIIDDWTPDQISKINPDLLLTYSSDWFEAYYCTMRAKQLKIPSLYLMDGIHEWRHQWENLAFGAGGGPLYHQPIATDKIACYGKRSFRRLEAWGNIGKCEIVGMPRFDHYIENPVIMNKQQINNKRLLIMTANTPFFTPKQKKIVYTSILDLKNYLDTQNIWEPIWRVAKEIQSDLGLVDHFDFLKGKPLRKVFSESHAVISTPSTVLLESMLVRLPTADLDYSNDPKYVQTAWSITANDHIAKVLSELHNPPRNKFVFQDDILHDSLECSSPSAPRLVSLIIKMIELGKNDREKKQSLNFPGRILVSEKGGYSLPSKDFDFSMLYPEHPIYKNKDIHALQNLVTQLTDENRYLKIQLKRNRFWMKGARKIQKILRKVKFINEK